MTLKALKLSIIQAVTASEDEMLLRTVLELLTKLETKPSTTLDFKNLAEQIIGERLDSVITTTPDDADAAELQREIDEAFGME